MRDAVASSSNHTLAMVAAGSIMLLAVMVIGVFVTENGVSWMVVILVCIRLVPDYYYALKYDMDELHSIEELLQKHPEAKGKIRKTFFEN